MIRAKVKSTVASRLKLNLEVAFRLSENTVKALIGKRVKFHKDWRDQPFGRSKPNFLGKTVVIEQVDIDIQSRRISVQPAGCRCFAILMDLSYPCYEECELVN